MSTLKVTNIAGLTGSSTDVMSGLAKSWAKSDFSTTMPDSFNVASLTDTSGGDNSINYTSNMGNANYSVSVMFEASSSNDTNLNCCVKHSSQSTSAVGGQTGNVSGSLFDVTSLYFAVSGDLA
jgi:hypothetical protein